MDRRSLALLAALLLLALTSAAPAIVAAGGGCHGDADGSVYMEGDGTTVIRMDTCSFAPTVSRVAVGTTVRFLNTATIQHQVVGRSGTWGSVLLDPGQEYSETFAADGVYPYTCPLHPGMVGAIVVGDAAAGEAAAQGADLATAVQPADPAATAADPTSLAIVGLAGLVIGLAIGAFATWARRRTTG
jgi:plastocyanin